MATRSVTLPKTETSAHPCPCGCAPCEGTCCQLDCLEQPRFFCGQLLTDQDLTKLLNWSQDKLRLSRYRDGWGVVCGLEVRCDPKQPGRIIVGPGYAVSCCGDDIIVCQDTPYDLSEACHEEADPCSGLHVRSTKAAGDIPSADPTHGAYDDAPWAFLDREQLPQQTRAVDLYIGYREELADPQTALGHSVCREVAACEYSRTRELFSLTWQPAVIGSDPMTAAAMGWHEAYDRCLDVIVRFRNQFPSLTGQGEAVQRWLLRWIDKHPLHQFCYLRDLICALPAELLADERRLVGMLFLLVQDCRNAFLSCHCQDCPEGPGVPLARVWLRAMEGQNSRNCHILTVDPYPPYRRPISLECWPAPLGQVNLGQVIWQQWDAACSTLAAMGLTIAGEESFALPATVAELERALDCDLFLPCGQAPVIQLLEGAGFGKRVVGLCGTPVQPPSTEPPETETGEDELTIINGIGTERALRLREAGITTFAKLAETPIERLKELFPNVRENALRQWQDQARDLGD